MASRSGETHRLPGLDGLRAVSIILVIFSHLAISGPLIANDWINSFFSNGRYGVDIFFTISGLLITWLLLREEKTRGTISLKDFYARRAVRILPPALSYLIVTLVVSAFRGPVAWRSFVASLLFCRNVVGEGLPPFFTINTHYFGSIDTGHFWSLSIEEQFYLIWPLLFLFLLPRFRVWILLGCCIAEPIWRQLHYHVLVSPHLNLWRADLACDNILFGCLIACAMEDRRGRKLLSNAFFRSDIMVAACAAMIVISFTTVVSEAPGSIGFFIFPVRSLCTGLIVHRAIRTVPGKHSILDRVLNLGFVVAIGQLSYSLYLWQQPFCMPTGMFHTDSRIINLLATLLCAGASFLLIERPAQQLRRRLGSRTAALIESPFPRASLVLSETA